MSHRLLALALFLSTNAFAAKCQLSSRSPGEVASENFVVTSGNNQVLFVSDFIAKPEQRMMVRKLLIDAGTYYDLLTGVIRLYDGDKNALHEMDSLKMFIQSSLEQSDFNYVYLNMPTDLFNELETTAKIFASISYDFERTQGHERHEMLERYIAASVGLGTFFHQTHPLLFNNVDFQSFAARDPLESHAEVSRADARYQELLGEFSANRKTRSQFVAAARKLRSGGYKGDSKAEIKEDILRHFWSSAKPKISGWIDLELAEKSDGRAASAREEPEEKPKSRRREKERAQKEEEPPPAPAPALVKEVAPPPAKIDKSAPPFRAEAFLKKEGKGLVLIPRDGFKRVQAKFKSLCD
jgi:hypothetical protein